MISWYSLPSELKSTILQQCITTITKDLTTIVPADWPSESQWMLDLLKIAPELKDEFVNTIEMKRDEADAEAGFVENLGPRYGEVYGYEIEGDYDDDFFDEDSEDDDFDDWDSIDRDPSFDKWAWREKYDELQLKVDICEFLLEEMEDEGVDDEEVEAEDVEAKATAAGKMDVKEMAIEKVNAKEMAAEKMEEAKKLGAENTEAEKMGAEKVKLDG